MGPRTSTAQSQGSAKATTKRTKTHTQTNTHTHMCAHMWTCSAGVHGVSITPCTRGGCLRLYSAPSQVLQPLRCQPRSAGRSRAYRQASYTAQRQRQYGVGHYRYGMQRGRSGWCVVSRRRSSGCESAARGAGAACGADTQCGRVAQRLRGAVRGSETGHVGRRVPGTRRAATSSEGR